MVEINRSDRSYDARSHWSWDIDRSEVPTRNMVCPCDLEGYLLSKLEVEYSWINGAITNSDSNHGHHMMRKSWMSQVGDGNTCLDHAWLFERKAFDGAAKKQLEAWSKINPIVSKLLLIKPRWGLSVAIDHADAEGNLLELFNHSLHTGSLEEAELAKERIAAVVTAIDWNLVARDMMRRRGEWEALPRDGQRSWKFEFVMSL